MRSARTASRALRAFALGALLALAVNAFAQSSERLSAGEWSAIKRVIETQLAALRRGDAESAFAFATRSLRQQFGDSAAFMRMIHAGYQPLLDARYTEFLEGAVIDGTTIQPLRLVLADNSVLVALYRMQKESGRWRIAGCVLAPSTVKAV